MAEPGSLTFDYHTWLTPNSSSDSWPVFNKNRINYILVYSGAFNPPHIGHLNFARESLLHAGRDLHIVDVLFDPRSNDWMQEHKRSDLMLPHATRLQMLCDDKRLSMSAHVLPNTDGLLEWQYSNSETRVRYIRLRSTETGINVDDCIRDWPKGFKVNTYGRHSAGTYTASSLSLTAWATLHVSGDEVQRYQRMVANDKGVVKGFLRVITRGPDEKKSSISFSGIKALARVIGDQELQSSDLMRAVVLGWRTLSRDATWVKWRANQVSGGDSGVSEQSRDILERELKDAWELEERNFQDAGQGDTTLTSSKIQN
jgi:hypothetical protein